MRVGRVSCDTSPSQRRSAVATAVVAGLVVISGSTVGCLDPKLKSGVSCSPQDHCPSPYFCTTDGSRVCVLHPYDGGGGSVAVDVATPPSHPLTAGEERVWIFFDSLRGLNRDIFAVHPDGSAGWTVVSDPATDQEPAVSPDGQTLAFSSNRTGLFQIYLMALPAGAATQLTMDSKGAAQPAWSPDGSQVVYSGSQGLSAMTKDGSSARLVVGAPASPFGQFQHPTFAPDGAIFSDQGNAISEIDADGKGVTSIISGVAGSLQHPFVAANGLSMVFSTNVCAINGQRPINGIWLVPLGEPIQICSTGSRLTSPSGAGSRFPSLGPGGLIAYENEMTPAKIGILLADGTTNTITDGNSDDRNPSWGTLQ